jgi:DNA-directed RNA polymerase subunit RPC12/RpoP
MSKNEGLQFYRCVLCGHIVTIWDVKAGNGCAKCANRKIKPTNLSIWEMAKEIFRHPKIWTWKNEQL